MKITSYIHMLCKVDLLVELIKILGSIQIIEKYYKNL